MIVISGEARVRPDRWEEAAALARQMSENTRQQPGCLSSGYYCAIENPERFFLFQVWDSEEALTNHYRQDYVRDFYARLPELLDGSAAIRFLNRYEIQEHSPL